MFRHAFPCPRHAARRLLAAFCAALVLLPALALAQAKAETFAEQWRGKDAKSRVAFVEGFYQGAFQVCAQNANATEAIADCMKNVYGGQTASEAAKTLDDFYAEPENARIDFGSALTAAAMRARGFDEETITDYVTFCRNLVK